MGKCDTIELLRLEGRYLKFIVENHTELNLLEHVEKCEECQKEILRAVPQSSDYRNPVNFINARIQWRKRRLKELMENAEMELKSLRARLADP